MQSWATKIVAASLILAGVVHLLPLVGLLGVSKLEALYGLPFSDPNLAILMRHRALLFGLLGLFLIAAAFQPLLQAYALAAGLISLVGFLWLALSTGGYNAALARVVMVDCVALLALVIGAALYGWSKLGR